MAGCRQARCWKSRGLSLDLKAAGDYEEHTYSVSPRVPANMTRGASMCPKASRQQHQAHCDDLRVTLGWVSNLSLAFSWRTCFTSCSLCWPTWPRGRWPGGPPSMSSPSSSPSLVSFPSALTCQPEVVRHRGACSAPANPIVTASS